MKTSKKIISMLLCVVMIASTFCGLGLVLDDFVAEAADVFNPNITITNTHTNSAGATVTISITQQRVVGTTDNAYLSTYQEYQNKLLGGKMTNSPTNFVIPGLSATDNYIPQGLAYWEEKDWFLISAHDDDHETNSVIYVLDGQTAEFIKLIVLLNTDGTDCTEHGGGLCCSEYNLYYTHSGSTIAYVSLDTVAKALEGKESACVQFKEKRNLKGELNGASTSYCSYGSGTLWTGNFYIENNDSYGTKGNKDYGSILLGYKLYGNSSDEEWAYFRNGANIMKLNSTAQQSSTSGNTTMTYTTTSDDGATVDIAGTVTSDGSLEESGEITATFGTTKTSDTYWSGSPLHNLTLGNKYRIEFDTTYRNTDFYLFAPGGKHTNFKYIATVTDNGDGTWHFKAEFTPGTKPTGADSSWGTDDVTDANYTGEYTLRFDIDNPPSGTTNFRISNLSIRYVNGWIDKLDPDLIGTSCVGNPYYVVTFTGGTNNIDKIQYAIHDQGKLYISRSYSRSEGDSHIREFSVGYIDLNAPGDTDITVNGRLRKCYLINHSENFQLFGGSGEKADDSDSAAQKMIHMGEGLVSIGDNIYIISESAADEYMNHDTGGVAGIAVTEKCPQPIDVMWKIDHHELLNEEKSYDDTAALCYQKVNSISEINAYDDYIIVHESPVKDSLTQNNYLYALDSYGGYGDRYLPKYSDAANSPTQMLTGDSMGVVGYEIKDYEIDGDKLYITEEDDAYTSIRWNITSAGTDTVKIDSKELQFASNKHFNFGQRLFTMMADGSAGVNNMRLEQYNGEAGNFVIYNSDGYYLWCNDGSNQSYIDAYTNYYNNHSALGYLPNYHHLTELAGTFHADAKRKSTEGGNLTGGDVGADMMIVNIYKRVTDPYSSVYNSRIYSDLRAELQSDGTYNIILETYANSPLQYQTLDADRPTDFIFLLDGSSSMWTNTDTSVGYHHDTSWSALQAGQFNYNGTKYDGSNDFNYNKELKSGMYFRLPDGEYAEISLAMNQGPTEKGNWWEIDYSEYSRDFWLWCTHPVTGRCYKLSLNGYLIANECTGDPNSDSVNRITDEQYLANASTLGYASASEILSEAKNDINRTDYHTASAGNYNTKDPRKKYESFKGIYYEAPAKSMNMSRLEAMQLAVNNLTYKIAENAASSNLDHRIAVVSYGNAKDDNSGLRTGMFTNTSTELKNINSLTATDYANAFYTVDKFDYARCCINNLAVSYSYNETNCNTYSNLGFEMANQIVANSGANYLGSGDRSVAIIVITDGVPGTGTNSASTANATANLAIAEALKSKNLGAYIYTVQIGANSMSGFSMDEYMDFTSSKYLFAEDMYNPGDKNISSINYRIDIPTGTAFVLDDITNNIFSNVQSNSKNAMAKLSETSVIREQLNNSFIIPADYTVKTQTASIYYDELDRLHWKDPVSSSLATTVDASSREIIVDGFDYSANCVTQSNEANGKKLIVTISGVLANTDEVLDNTSINVNDHTGIYETREKMNANDAVKRFPTEHFSISEYNFIMDYDLPMLDTEVNGTLCSVDSTIQRQSTYKESLSTDNINIDFTNSNQDLIYTLKQDEDKGYVLIKRDDGTYDWFSINIIPASNVYYEESRLTPLAIDTSKCAWTSEGTSTSTYQKTSDDTDVYGYDDNYNNTADYSNGTYMVATVDEKTNLTQTQTFSFKGKGFDLVSACGPETGILLVGIKDSTTGKYVKGYLIDTYYNDTSYNTTLTQVPVLHCELDNAGEYTVEITGAYIDSLYNPKDQTATASLDDEVDMSVPAEEIGMFAALGMPEFDELDIEAVWMDENSVLNTSAQVMTTADSTTEVAEKVGPRKVYIDGYRVYNPTIEDDSLYIASEQNATYYNVANAIENSQFDGSDLVESMIAYVENKGDKTFGFGEYRNNGGPANEIYLEKNDSITFKLSVNSQARAAIAPSVMLGLRAVTGTPAAKVNDASFGVTSKTEMYYDVSSYLSGTGTNAVYTVTVTNTGDGILAVNTLKLTNAELVTTSAADLPMVTNLMMMSATPVEVSTLNTRGYANQHPDYVPSEPGTTNPDPDLDPVSRPGDTKVDFSNIGDLIDAGSVTPASFLAAILDIFKKLFANLGKLLFSI